MANTNSTGSDSAPPIPPTVSTQPLSLPFDVKAARDAGYSDQDIVDHVKTRFAPFKFEEALKAGYSPTEILDYLQPHPSGVVDSLRQGTADVLGGIGKTVETHAGTGPVSKWLQSKAAAVAPPNYTASPIFDENGVHLSGILPTLARAAPEAAGAVIAAGLAPEALGAAGPIAAGAGAYALMNAGNEDQQAAATRTGNPNATPDVADLVRGDVTAAGSGLVSALPIGRFLPASGPIAATGIRGVTAALKKLGVTSASQGASSGAADVVNQVGQSVGTPGGVRVDPTEVANSTASGAAGGAIAGAIPSARESLDAAKYRGITPDLQPAATQFANRLQKAADGANLDAGVIGGGAALRTGADAFAKARDAVHSELGEAVADLRGRVTLPTDANNVLNAAVSGKQPSVSDYATLSAALKGAPQADNVLNLVRQAHVADIVANGGALSHGKFVGGLSALPTLLNAHTAEKAGLAALMAGAAIEGGAGHLITYSPPAIAAMAGVAGAARIADKLTGARSPAGRFVRNFADGSTPVREPVSAPQPAQGPPMSPTGPKVPLAPTPWGTASPQAPVAPPVAQGSIIPPRVRSQMDALDMLAKLKTANASAPAEAPAVNPLALPANIKGPAASIMRGVALAQRMRDGATEANTQAPAAEPPDNPLALPKGITTPAVTLMRGAALANKLRNASAATAPAGATRQQVPAAVTTAANATTVKTNSGNIKLPLAPYAALRAPEAAQRILEDRIAAGVPIDNPDTYRAKIIGVLTALREKTLAVAQDAPSIPAAALARFEGVRSQQAATKYRDYLKREYTGAAGVLDRVFSDEAIEKQWAAKR